MESNSRNEEKKIIKKFNNSNYKKGLFYIYKGIFVNFCLRV